MSNPFDALLMLSGGKDSCSLAFMLKEQGVNFYAITIDNGFLSETAFKNIFKLCKILDIDHSFNRPKPSVYQNAIMPLVSEGMERACTACSGITIELCRRIAVGAGIQKLYAGFTKYTASAAGWSPAKEKELEGGVILVNPYYEAYDLEAIRKVMGDNGLEFDPVKTNCVLLPDLLKNTNRLGLPNHLKKEIHDLHADKRISDAEEKYYSSFVGQE